VNRFFDYSYDAFIDISGKIVEISDTLRRHSNLPLQRSANVFPDNDDGLEEVDNASDLLQSKTANTIELAKKSIVQNPDIKKAATAAVYSFNYISRLP
jgi:hypothetical protein